jgi:outer membrane protein TolC
VGNTEDILKLDLGYTKDSPEWGRHIHATQGPRDVNPSDFNEGTLIEKALSIRPELRELEARVEKAKLGTAVAKNSTLPQLNLVGGIGYNGLAGDGIAGKIFVNQNFHDAWDQITGLDYKSWSVGLSLRYPIGNRAAHYAYQGARLQQNSTEIQFEKKKLVVANEVRYSLRNLEAAHKRVAAAKVNLDLQKQKLDAEEKKFQNGLSTSFQVLSYQNDLLSAATVLLRAHLDREIAYASLDRAVGTYLENRGFKEIS